MSLVQCRCITGIRYHYDKWYIFSWFITQRQKKPLKLSSKDWRYRLILEEKTQKTLLHFTSIDSFYILHTTYFPISRISYQIENILGNLKTAWIRCDKGAGYPWADWFLRLSDMTDPRFYLCINLDQAKMYKWHLWITAVDILKFFTIMRF